MSNFVIRKEQLNNIALTLSELSTLVNPWYLFVFTRKFGEPITVKCSLQVSASNSRFDLVQILDGANPLPLQGEVDLSLGEWSYKVYESVDQTLEIDETTGHVIQKGLIISTNGNI